MKLYLIAIASLLSITACAAAATVLAVETAVVDLTGAVCTQLDKQTEPGWVSFVCALDQGLGGGNNGMSSVKGRLQTITIQVPADGAAAFAAAHKAPVLVVDGGKG
jgi:hypothetical protein